MAQDPIEILHNDADVVVCVKQVGMVSEVGGKRSLPDILTEQLREGGESVTLYPVHRLDREVGGVMVFAKTSESAAALSRLIQQDAFEKRYFAVLCGIPEWGDNTLVDLLYHDKSKNKTYVVKKERRGVRRAVLDYRVVAYSKYGEQDVSMVDVRLHTGRTHQIRAQFASRKLPMFGDGRYGGIRDGGMGLWSYRLCFEHPTSGEIVEFQKYPPVTELPFRLFGDVMEKYKKVRESLRGL